MSTSESSADAQARSNRIQAIANDCIVRRAAGMELSDESIIEEYPELMPELGEWLRAVDLLQAVRNEPIEGDLSQEDMRIACPYCETSMSVDEHASLSKVTCPSCGRHFHASVEETLSSGSGSSATSAAPDAPDRIGRYRIEKILGQGAFGRVFLAHDEELGRSVAVKVPHARLVAARAQVDLYLAEAQAVASLDHPHIVPVHDVGSSDEFPYFMVCKYIEGTDLSTMLKSASRLKYAETAELVAVLAEALHYSHTQGLVHRDVKPSNILIGGDNTPYLVDFGLALREENVGTGPRYAGTPAYMSPEQARGEGHRVDGRSDIFSLGVVLYELLVGRRPFRGKTQADLFEQLISYEPRPLRQYDDQIPKELERICHKAMAKRALDRYFTAKDFAEDLREFLHGQTVTKDSTASGSSGVAVLDSVTNTDSTSSAGVSSSGNANASGSSLGSEPIRIVPKGLRSFDAHDADFFLELLPGPRDRNGLPDSIRFWKTRIEELDPDKTFAVGLIYGPSGCGKSSLVKAGLLPRLSEDVITVYIEATVDSIESQLTWALHKHFPILEDQLNLKETLAALRRGQAIPPSKKVLIVLDQFEQWLHAKTDQENAELVQALRQCDGGRVQCILMVRDDFWMAVARFLRELEVRLLEDHNFTAVDLFSERHARKVLSAFGRAFGALPEQAEKTSKSQREFLKEAVTGLAKERKVTCVRLALFADMMKDKSWDPATLKASGGLEGVGVTFLEETFSSSTASPELRYHQKAVRAVLTALLPDAVSDIKGHMRSYDELLEASGYARRRQDFDDLIKVLDSDIRLITPSDLEGSKSEHESVPSTGTGQKYFQLTHDYLVHPLREWVTRKQKETRRGRAELRLDESSVLWGAKPDNRHLPSWREYGNIRLLTRRQNWTEPQRKMMSRAGRIHGIRWTSNALLVATVIGITMMFTINHRKVAERVRTAVSKINAERGDIDLLLKELEDFHQDDIVLEELRKEFQDDNRRGKLQLAFVMASYDDVKTEFLVEQIKSAPPDAVDNLVAALERRKSEAIQELESMADTANVHHKARLAVVAMHLDHPKLAAEMCQFRADPIQRAWFIEECSKWHGNISKLAELAETSDNKPFRTAVANAVGSMPTDDSKEVDIREWKELLLGWFATEPDKLTHSTADWVLRRWEIEHVAKPTLPSEVDEWLRDHDWYVNTVGMTMLEIPNGNFVRRDESDGEGIHDPAVIIDQTVTLTETFLLADREVTLRQFQQFIEDDGYPDKEKPEDWPGGFSRIGNPILDHPVNMICWYDAILYCNWLSVKERLKPCYERTGDTETFKRTGELEFDIWQLTSNANGYRLPTEAEWEYACRAGATTAFSHGNEELLLNGYAVFRSPTTEPPGTKFPNAWGLFDVHGNLNEWCEDWWGDYGSKRAITNPPGPARAQSINWRIKRGGFWEGHPFFLKASRRWGGEPGTRTKFCGIRVARTFP